MKEEQRIIDGCQRVADIILHAERLPFLDEHLQTVQTAIIENDVLAEQFYHDGIHK